jgi:hypothetical protein
LPAEATPFLAEPIAPRAAHPLQPVHAAPVEATDLPDFIDLSDAVVLPIWAMRPVRIRGQSTFR